MRDYMLLLPILFPALAGLFTLVIKKQFSNQTFRTIYVGVVLCLTLIFNFYSMFNYNELSLYNFTKTLIIKFKVDELTYLFNSLVTIMFLFAGIFSFEYMKHEKNNESFYFFYLLTESALLALGYSSNFLTFYIFYEIITLFSLPLATHTKTKDAIKSGKKYLFYSIFGASLTLVGLFVINKYGNIEFLEGGYPQLFTQVGKDTMLLIVFFITILGFSIKASMFPFHSWLTDVHPVSPAPASAVFSGIITKTGVLAIIRVIYYQIGADYLRGTWVQNTFMCLTLITIFMGSLIAYKENIMKKRLAYSSVSQVSYALFGLSTLSPIGLVGTLLQIVFHSISKNILIMAVGAIIYKEHKTKVNEIKGIGKNMPIVMWCFTIAGLALVGIPPLTGYVSKWYLAMGSLESEVPTFTYLGPIILLISALLTFGYLITISIDAFFPGSNFDYKMIKNTEPNLYMLLPLLILAVACIVFGIYATPFINFFSNIAIKLLWAI